MRYPDWNPMSPHIARPRTVAALFLLLAIAWPRALRAQVETPPATIDIEADADQIASYCCPDKWLFFDAEYLFWWSRGAHLPPLVTTSPSGTEIQDAGVLGEPGTQVLFGDELTSSGPRSGLRLRAGMAIDDLHQWWLVADTFALPSYADTFLATSSGSPILARPFYDEAIQMRNSELIGFPGLVAGGIAVDASNELWGAGIALHKNVLCCPGEGCEAGYRMDVLAGYRFLELSDSVQIYERLVATDVQGPLLLGTQIEVYDEYASHSYFHGIDLGIRGELAQKPLFRLRGSARCAGPILSSAERLRHNASLRPRPAAGLVSRWTAGPGRLAGRTHGSRVCRRAASRIARWTAESPTACDARLGTRSSTGARSCGQVNRFDTAIDSSQLPSGAGAPMQVASCRCKVPASGHKD